MCLPCCGPHLLYCLDLCCLFCLLDASRATVENQRGVWTVHSIPVPLHIPALHLLHNSPPQSWERLTEHEHNIPREDIHVGSWCRSQLPPAQRQFPDLLPILSHHFWKGFLISTCELSCKFPAPSLPALARVFLGVILFTLDNMSRMPSERFISAAGQHGSWCSMFGPTILGQKRVDLHFQLFVVFFPSGTSGNLWKCSSTSPHPYPYNHIYTVSKNKYYIYHKCTLKSRLASML